MSRGGIIMMVLILTLVWGGFAAAVGVAMARERQGRREQDGSTNPEPGRQTPPEQGGG